MPNNKLLFSVAAIALSGYICGTAGAAEIMAQKVVAEVKAAHPEITGLEIAATRSEQEGCKTIATTEANGMGEKCDNDEFTAMKTNRPFVEQEKDEFDATLPLHDAAGKIIGTVGMDLKAAPGQTKETVTRQAKQIAAELEKRFSSKEKLFEAVK
jgi:hypothetical protein